MGAYDACDTRSHNKKLLKENSEFLFGETKRWADLRIYPISSCEILSRDYSTVFNAELKFLNFLFDKGRTSSEKFLSKLTLLIG
ncbi:hypothetical protein ACQUW5_13400 [Legionella sp. CNM-1927-20]|uniref:hypothetical protein n=1 Tax=Legionella sp. CNM-1927-20 TaxID=3422221 RepID=UPI00403AE914